MGVHLIPHLMEPLPLVFLAALQMPVVSGSTLAVQSLVHTAGYQCLPF